MVALNAFRDDPASELEWVRQQACKAGALDAAISTHWADGGQGAERLAQAVIEAARQESNVPVIYMISNGRSRRKSKPLPPECMGPRLSRLVRKRRRQIKTASRLGLIGCRSVWPRRRYLCRTTRPSKEAPTGFVLPIRNCECSRGLGFLTAVCSGMQLLPGLPKKPAGERMESGCQTGEIVGLS